MFGFFVVKELLGSDAQGAAFMVKAESKMNALIRGTLFLPPYLRPSQCKIAEGSVLWGCLDEQTGRGFAMFGKDDADYQYFMDADLELRQSLTVMKKVMVKDSIEASKDIKSTDGDVKAGAISLKGHTHTITAAKFEGTIDPSTKAASGTISGATEVAQ